MSVYVEQNGVAITFFNAESWTILSPIEQSIKEKIATFGTPLKEWDIRINFGVKTGFNKAFIIDSAKKDELIAADPKSAEIIRPDKSPASELARCRLPAQHLRFPLPGMDHSQKSERGRRQCL